MRCIELLQCKIKRELIRRLLSLQLYRLRTVEKDLGILEQRIQEKLKSYEAQLALLEEIPGIDETLAAAIIAELGVDLGVFENVSQLSSWAGVVLGTTNRPASARAVVFPRAMSI